MELQIKPGVTGVINGFPVAGRLRGPVPRPQFRFNARPVNLTKSGRRNPLKHGTEGRPEPGSPLLPILRCKCFILKRESEVRDNSSILKVRGRSEGDQKEGRYNQIVNIHPTKNRRIAHFHSSPKIDFIFVSSDSYFLRLRLAVRTYNNVNYCSTWSIRYSCNSGGSPLLMADRTLAIRHSRSPKFAGSIGS